MKRKLFFIVMLLTANMLVGCSEDPPASTPGNPQPGGEMGMEDMVGADDGTQGSDMSSNAAQPQLVVQPVSGSGVVKGAKFRAHIQVGRLVDVSPGK